MKEKIFSICFVGLPHAVSVFQTGIGKELEVKQKTQLEKRWTSLEVVFTMRYEWTQTFQHFQSRQSNSLEFLIPVPKNCHCKTQHFRF